MRIDPIVPDMPVSGPAGPGAATPSLGGGFAQLVDAASVQLDRAAAAEAAFAAKTGGLQEMVVERARADIALAVATSGVQHAAQALNSLLGMQI